MSMLKPNVVFALFIGLVAQSSFCSANDDAKAKPREKLPTAIGEAIRLLEAKEHENFIKDFLSPDDLKQLADK